MLFSYVSNTLKVNHEYHHTVNVLSLLMHMSYTQLNLLFHVRVYISSTAIKTDTKQNLKDEIEKDWRLILHDDTVHTIQQVCDILTMVSKIRQTSQT